MPSPLAKSQKYLMSQKVHKTKEILKDVTYSAEINLKNQEKGINQFSCYYYNVNEECLTSGITNDYDISLGGWYGYKPSLRKGKGLWVPNEDETLIMGNNAVKEYCIKFIAEFDTAVKESDLSESRIDALEKEVVVLKKALADTLDLLQSIARAR
jgi:hypothetical protein